MRRPHVTIWQLMATVAVAAVLLWGGTLARDYFFPPPAPPLLPIPEPDIPAGYLLPDPGHADWPKVYTNMDDVANKIFPRRRLVFRLDLKKRRWVRDHKYEELLMHPPAHRGRDVTPRPRAAGPASTSPKSTGGSPRQPPIPEPVLPDGEWLEDPPSPGTADMRIWTRADDVLCNIDSPRRRRVVFRLDRSKRLWVRDYKAEALLRKPPDRRPPTEVPTPGGSATP